MRVAFTVEGRPVPQGSMVASYNRKQQVAHVHHQQGEALAVWRSTVRLAAKAEGVEPSALPVRLSIQFGMPRPKAHTELRGGRLIVKMQHYYDRPAVAPDLDKLIRAIMDSLSGTLYHDDAQVVEIMASKVYSDRTFIEVSDEEMSERREAFTTVPAGLGVNTPKDTRKG